MWMMGSESVNTSEDEDCCVEWWQPLKYNCGRIAVKDGGERECIILIVDSFAGDEMDVDGY